MSRRPSRVAFQLLVPLATALVLWFLFPWVAMFAESAALSLRRFWWLVLAIALGGWLIWMLGKRNP